MSAVILGVVAALLAVLAAKSFRIIGQAEVMVVERLGRFHRVARSGFNVLIPFFERAKTIDVRYFEADALGNKKMIASTIARIDLREQVLNFPS